MTGDESKVVGRIAPSDDNDSTPRPQVSRPATGEGEGASESPPAASPPSLGPLEAAEVVCKRLEDVHRLVMNMRVDVSKRLERVPDVNVRMAMNQQLVMIEVQAALIAGVQCALALVAGVYTDVEGIAAVYRGGELQS